MIGRATGWVAFFVLLLSAGAARGEEEGATATMVPVPALDATTTTTNSTTTSSTTTNTTATSTTTAAPLEPPRLDLNRATVDELSSLPGIGEKRAEAIAAQRTKAPFTRVTQLLLVKGIGKKTLSRLRPLITVGPLESGVPKLETKASASKRRGLRPPAGCPPPSAPTSS